MHYINKKDFLKALEMINMITLPEKSAADIRNDEMTKYLSKLIEKIPHECFNALENEKFRGIDLPRLMPALRNCPSNAMKRARQFIDGYCIR